MISAQEAARYPAGVDPSKCPNFPICDNAALHNTNQYAQPQAYSQPQWNYQPQPAAQPQWNYQPQPAPYTAPAYSAPAYNQYQQPAYQPQAQNYIAAPQPADPSGGDKYDFAEDMFETCWPIFFFFSHPSLDIPLV